MSTQLGRLVDEAATRAGLNDYQLSQLVVKRLPDGRTYSSKQIARLRALEVRYVPRDVVQALIDIGDLRLDPDETWHASGLWPEGLDLTLYRQMRDEMDERIAAGPVHARAQAARRRARRGRPEGPDRTRQAYSPLRRAVRRPPATFALAGEVAA